jgi:hypothetical protein
MSPILRLILALAMRNLTTFDIRLRSTKLRPRSSA